MITAQQDGRNLRLTVEGIDEPFIIRPIPGNAGHQITEVYIRTLARAAEPSDMALALAIALDGAQRTESGGWAPVPPEERVNSLRLGDEVSAAEGEDISMAAFFWQTILNVAGVNAYLSAGGGVGGLEKATWALVHRLGLSPETTSPSSALESLIQLQGSIPSTSSLPGGAKPGKQPQDRRPKQSSASTG